MRTQAYRRGSSGKLKSDQVYQCVSTGRFEANLGDTVRRLVKPVAMPPRLPELIKRARRLALDRDRLIQELARDWIAALKGQGFSPRDLEELWAGLTEEAVRRLAKESTQRRRRGDDPARGQ